MQSWCAAMAGRSKMMDGWMDWDKTEQAQTVGRRYKVNGWVNLLIADWCYHVDRGKRNIWKLCFYDMFLEPLESLVACHGVPFDLWSKKIMGEWWSSCCFIRADIILEVLFTICYPDSQSYTGAAHQFVVSTTSIPLSKPWRASSSRPNAITTQHINHCTRQLWQTARVWLRKWKSSILSIHDHLQRSGCLQVGSVEVNVSSLASRYGELQKVCFI